MLFKCGVSGFMLPSEKPTVASLPISSAMMSRMFSPDFIGVSTSTGVSTLSPVLQLSTKMATSINRAIIRIRHMLYLMRIIAQTLNGRKK